MFQPTKIILVESGSKLNGTKVYFCCLGSDTGDENFSGSEGEKEKKRAEKAEKKLKKAEKKKTSKPSGERTSKKKKKTKLPGQPKKPMSAYFMWLNEEGREKIKVLFK